MYVYLTSTTILVVYDRCRGYPYHKRVTMHTINYMKYPRAIASVCDGLLVTRDMNSHKLTTPLMHRIRGKHVKKRLFLFHYRYK